MNPHKGEVAFDAGGKQYVLRFSIDAICALEAEAGKGILAIVNELQNTEKMSLSLARQILWAGLQENHPELTPKEAGELIPEAGGMSKVYELFGEAFQSSFPQLKGGSAHPRKAGSLKNGIGPHSSVRGAGSTATTKASGEKHQGKSS